MKYFSMFSGIGGFELAIKQAYDLQNILPSGQSEYETENPASLGQGGVVPESSTRLGNPVCVGYSEIDKYAIQVYHSHFDHTNYGNATTINADELPDFDLLVGGFPCQAFSIAGKRRGFEDTRGTLFFDIARILRAKQPRNFVLENVKGLLSHDNGQTFRTIIATLADLGYDLQWQVLNSKNFGVPQNRERVFIVGHLRGTPRPEVFPITGKNENLIKESATGIAVIGSSQKHAAITYGYTPTLSTAMGQGGGQTPMLLQKVDKIGIQEERNSMQVRRLTPLECERLQGFPDGWTKGISDSQRYKTLGNAVTVNTVQAVIERLAVI